jgi:hypothetical protein
MAQGGARKGAGRPKGVYNTSTLNAIAFREALFAAVAKEKEPIFQALIKEAKAGNIPAIKEILDRILGRSKEFMDLTSDGEKLNFNPSKLSGEELTKAIKDVIRTLSQGKGSKS